ncbi:LysR substrate-binding domain-containing protein [Paraburkholderia phytofirmans]|jgi:DNA-binding transcriptional LysR family regulator|uniref:LysR substrate-binding domain-containing protein n=1 Tax=Paraburkholderia sp. BL9I2N2 TaxID=1938809 RepID=UPI00104816CA|nr:LysR substrate-binding domain-containing protein [Paraburkholderia sp. BL9I2N2]TCK96663.1 LysR family transcriptional regulator [Paraburkholderia sp. BL9I2N2]
MAHTSPHAAAARPPLASLETVCHVAREGSFLAAAEAAGLTHGAISRRVAAVENWLGMTLFERHARGVRLTPDGQRFVGRIEQAFGIIDSAADQWRSPRSPQLVKLSVVPAFAKLWFFERQAAFETEAPALRIQLDIDHRNADIVSGDADLAIRYGRGNWRHLEVKPFLPEKLYPVAHPALAAQLAKQRHKRGDAALLDMPLLHDSDVTGWRAWFDALDMPLKPRAQDRRFEDYTLVLAAAEAGLGVALARVPLADAYLQRSGLVRVSRHEVASPLTYYFVHAKGENRPEVLALIDRMQAAQRTASYANAAVLRQ